MVSVAIRVDTSKAAAMYANLKAHIPDATVSALNVTARTARSDVIAEERRVFDRPTAYTLNATYIKPATKASLTATVKLKDESFKGTPAALYLGPQIAGGQREAKRFERALQYAGLMPAGWVAVPGWQARMDAYGNMESGQITEILSYLRANPDAYSNRSGRRRKGAKKPPLSKNEYFAVLPGSSSRFHPGVWQRGGYGGVRGSVRPVLFYVRKASYRGRLWFAGVVYAARDREFNRQFILALEYHARNARS